VRSSFCAGVSSQRQRLLRLRLLVTSWQTASAGLCVYFCSRVCASHGLMPYLEQRIKDKGHVLVVVAEGAGQCHVEKAHDSFGIQVSGVCSFLLKACANNISPTIPQE